MTDPLQAMKVPGRVVFDPTDVTNPDTGTSLGLLRDVVARRREAREEIVAAEFGIEPSESIYLGERWGVAMSMRGWSDQGFLTLFPSTFTGANGQRIGIRHPDPTADTGFRAGRIRGEPDSVVLLFAPLDTAHHPAVVWYRAIPHVAEEMELGFGNNTEVLLNVGFLATRDDSNRVVEVNLLEDLTAI